MNGTAGGAWRTAKDENGKVYYYNEAFESCDGAVLQVTRESRWDLPEVGPILFSMVRRQDGLGLPDLDDMDVDTVGEVLKDVVEADAEAPEELEPLASSWHIHNVIECWHLRRQDSMLDEPDREEAWTAHYCMSSSRMWTFSSIVSSTSEWHYRPTAVIILATMIGTTGKIESCRMRARTESC